MDVDGTGGSWVRDLESAYIADFEDYGDNGEGSRIDFQLCQDVDGGSLELFVGNTPAGGSTYRTPTALREHAAALLRVASEWEALTAPAVLDGGAR